MIRARYPMMELCGAKTRSNGGGPCRRWPMPNGRCYLHGGKSTGARTVEGKLRQKMASWKHGFYSKEARQERSQLKMLIQGQKTTLSGFL
jgi:hypothetical protein